MERLHRSEFLMVVWVTIMPILYLPLNLRGRNAKFLGNVTNWKVNQIEKLKDQFSDEDDGFLLPSRNESLGLQFVNFFVPKNLEFN